MKIRIKDLTLEQFVELMQNWETKQAIDGDYDNTWCEVWNDGRVCIDGVIDLNKIIEVPEE